MGYRVKLGRFPKVEHKKLKHFKSEEEICKYFDKPENNSYAHYRPKHYQQLVELGKYIDYKAQGLEIEQFYSFDLVDSEFVIVGRDFLVNVINEYRANVIEWYQDLEKCIQQGDTAQVSRHISNKIHEWDASRLNHLKTDDSAPLQYEDGQLTRSWKYEYAVFNLLHVLHTFDWENDYLIYSGW